MTAWRTNLALAQSHAQSSRFEPMLATCQQIIGVHGDDVAALLDVGTLLQNFGYLSRARVCFERVQQLEPNDLRAWVNLANLARETGDHAEARRLYAAVHASHPNHRVIRRNLLVSQEYAPAVSDFERLQQARAWGEWAVAQAGGVRARPVLVPLAERPLRIGYVSADLCQHTVGLFAKDVLKAHDSARVTVLAYHAGPVKDWVTDAIRAACTWRDVSALDDEALAAQIQQDQIDVLVDLSGHTAGSRLTVFAHRPAPVQVTWLGYFATTGLGYLDAVLLDEWHAPPGTEAQFIEPILRLPTGRLCYQPVPWSPPQVAPPPVVQPGHITFGCFNNTGKLNGGVFDLWARVLNAVPKSRLILKWRTLVNERLCNHIRAAFALRGIDPSRLELRPASFHVDLLKQYADIDIALDPFPFTGGLTSCEALWMGVPVITWPQSRVVSRQTFALLSTIGLPELAANDADDYVRIAQALAHDLPRLCNLRSGLRSKMQTSPLMDVAGFTRQLEAQLIDLYNTIDRCTMTQNETPSNQKTLLHVGAGHPQSGARIPPVFRTPHWKEIRLDIEPVNQPDILGTMLDMSAVADASVDALYSSHTIEHLYHNEIPTALKEFMRVLKPDGFAVVTCPDLQAAAQWIAEDKLMDVAYTAAGGQVTPFDMVFSHRNFTGRDKPFMAHHCGFTLKVLIATLKAAGFASVGGKRRTAAFDLWVLASKEALPDAKLLELAKQVLP